MGFNKKTNASIFSSGNKYFPLVLDSNNLLGAKTWSVFFNNSINSTTINATSAVQVVNSKLRGPGASSMVANISLTGTLDEDVDITWWRMPSGGSWTQVNATSHLRGSGVTDNYTFTSILRGESFKVLVYPKPFTVKLTVNATTVRWAASFSGGPRLTLPANAGTANVTGTVDAFVVGSNLPVNVASRNAGDTVDASSANPTNVSFWVNSTDLVGQDFSRSSVAITNINRNFTGTSMVPGDTLEVKCSDG